MFWKTKVYICMDLYNFIYLEEPANYPVCTSARLFGWVSLFTTTEKKDSSKLEIKFVEPVFNLLFKQRNWILASNFNFIISIIYYSVIWYFKHFDIRLFDLTEFVVWISKVKDWKVWVWGEPLVLFYYYQYI